MGGKNSLTFYYICRLRIILPSFHLFHVGYLRRGDSLLRKRTQAIQIAQLDWDLERVKKEAEKPMPQGIKYYGRYPKAMQRLMEDKKWLNPKSVI